MALARILADFVAKVAQCDSLIANAHRSDATGVPLFPRQEQQQITVAAFLNLFIGWEEFLEQTLAELLVGEPTISGKAPVKYASPPSVDAARTMIIGAQRYFDYANHDFVRKVVNIYFDAGYPFEPSLSSIFSDLTDLRTMRNASAHITSTTRTVLEALAQRVLNGPQPGIDLYTLLMSPDPRAASGVTVFESYKQRLLAAAPQIATG